MTMLKTHASRVAAGALISAALMAGLPSLTATAAGACAGPGCIKGVPPAAAAALPCSEPSCLSGTRPALASWPRSRLTGRTGHGIAPARAAGGVSTVAPEAAAQGGTGNAIVVNCPPPGVSVRDPGSGGC
jgi:hypothetical protein